jgi:hypothetical protein
LAHELGRELTTPYSPSYSGESDSQVRALADALLFADRIRTGKKIPRTERSTVDQVERWLKGVGLYAREELREGKSVDRVLKQQSKILGYVVNSRWKAAVLAAAEQVADEGGNHSDRARRGIERVERRAEKQRQEAAKGPVIKSADQLHRDKVRGEAIAAIVQGLLLMAVGVVVTLLATWVFSGLGVSYVIAIGALVGGVAYAGYGVALLLGRGIFVRPEHGRLFVIGIIVVAAAAWVVFR